MHNISCKDSNLYQIWGQELKRKEEFFYAFFNSISSSTVMEWEFLKGRDGVLLAKKVDKWVKNSQE